MTDSVSSRMNEAATRSFVCSLWVFFGLSILVDVVVSFPTDLGVQV